ncbi:hypothetical protein CHLRE_06g261350v5 [Chlamydomonas reinhardtii]|uniref:DUF952 domain-containing protein n=1 Tax=Chlamydomonas reinhardtii TaxID=3055 RepID=A0A2K3DMR1_CHLRE|nr:uncharacterized protein CHLRE_06g261350v5 [Chlamydomonas reinhardtii]PNW81813.1 hypothetical protein CHLRE_06g261350v5 [Chlamydomonas reinhardtii]
MAPLYHLVQESIWAKCKAEGTAYFPPTYDQDGFIHLTAEPRFLLGVGNQFYKDVAGTFLLLVLDYEKLSAKVIFEPAAPVGSKSSDGLSAGGEAKAKEELPLFPHLYGTIDFGAVTAELPIERDASGAFLSIPGLDAAAAP